MALPGATYRVDPDGTTWFGRADAPDDMVWAEGDDAAALRAEIDAAEAARMTAQADAGAPEPAAGVPDVAGAPPPEPAPEAPGPVASPPVRMGTTVMSDPMEEAQRAAEMGPPLPPAPPPSFGQQVWGAEGQQAHEAIPVVEVYQQYQESQGGGPMVYQQGRDPGWQNKTQSIRTTDALPPGVAQAELGLRGQMAADDLGRRVPMAEQQAAALEQQAAERAAYAEQARQEELAAAEHQRRVRAHYEAKRTGLEQERARIAAREVNPQRAFQNNGTFGNIMLILGAAMGGYAQGLGGGPNAVLPMMERMVERDIEEQRRQIDAEGAEADNQMADLMRRYGYDIEEAAEATRILQMEAATAEGASMAAYSGAADVRRQMEEYAAGVQQQLAEHTIRLNREMAGKSEQSLAQQWDPGQRAGWVGGGRKPMSYEQVRKELIARGQTPDEASRNAGAIITGSYRRPAGNATRVVLESGEGEGRQRVEFDAATAEEANKLRASQAAHKESMADWQIYERGLAEGATREERQAADDARERLSYGGAGKAFGAFNPEQKAAYQADMLPPVYALDEKGTARTIARGLGITDEKRRRKAAEMRKAVQRNWDAAMEAHSQGRSPRAPEKAEPPPKEPK